MFCLSDNTIDLVKSLINDQSTSTMHAKNLEDKELHVTAENKAFCRSSIAKLWMMLWHWLSSEQEETDTKLLLCAQIPFDIGFERVNIVTVDTEMAILIIYFQSMLNEKIYHHFRTYSTCSYSCLTCLKIDWIKVLFKLCVVYVFLVVATQLAVLKEKIL